VSAASTGTIVFCRCSHADFVSATEREQLQDALADRGIEVAVVDDLCERAAARDPEIIALAAKKDLRIIACHPRAVQWLLAWADSGIDSSGMTILNLREGLSDAVLASIPGEPGSGANSDVSPSGEVPEGAARWFPVLDYDRCTNCKQCISFCPFGVYSLDEEGKVRVTSPANCKDQCPACARMCPSVAIIFPKVKDTPIDGAFVSDEEVERRKADAIKERLKEGDIHSILAKRKMRAKNRRLGS
jgi:NAD-dependent dihydropyrimidine dehydrogenase PreA subunit